MPITHDSAMGSQGWLERISNLLTLPGLLTFILGPVIYLSFENLSGPRRPPPIPAVARAAAPCPVTTHDALVANGMPAERSFRFDGVEYALRRGDVACNMTRPMGTYDKTKVVICQFSAPVALEVETGGRTYAYALGGRPATIWFENGEPRCAADSELNVSRKIAMGR